ncbi:MAG: pilus assembly protein PilM [Planctomycetes bacterium]|nr:pilus assembly protein PilM [Planctomycetota bacterium]
MAKSVGLDAGAFEIKIVELDGSFRRPRLGKVSIDQVPPPAEAGVDDERARLERVATTASHAAKDAGISRDGVIYGFPCREAVLRNLTIPFVGDEAIRKVIKFEAEGTIHSHSVDDMVVDFTTLERLDHESRVLVAAVPKRTLGPQLQALDAAGIDPERVDLDTMALFRVAQWAGCFGEDVAEAAAAKAESGGGEDETLPVVVGAGVPGAGARARIVIDVGARSTRVLAVVNGQLVDMRALRVGDDSIAADVAARTGAPVDTAREFVTSIWSGSPPSRGGSGRHGARADDGEDYVLDDLDAEAESPTPAGEQVPAAPVVDLTPELVDASHERFLGRLRRELMRFLASVPRVSGVERAFLTGGASSLPGIHELIGEVFDCPVGALDVLGRLNHSLDDEQAQTLGPRIAVAVGLALGGLGRRDGFDFRQEELAYRRRFDRIKFPLAIACMLAVFLPFLYGVRKQKELTHLGMQYGLLYDVKEGDNAGTGRVRAQFWGYVRALMQSGSAQSVQRVLGNEEYEKLMRKLVGADTFERLPLIRAHLEQHLKREQEKTGVYQDLQLPSGVYVLSWMGDVVERMEPRLNEFLVTEVELQVPAQEKGRFLRFRVAMRGANYRERFELLRQAFADTFSNPNSPFAEFADSRDEDLFDDPNVEGAFFEIKMTLKARFGTEVQ